MARRPAGGGRVRRFFRALFGLRRDEPIPYDYYPYYSYGAVTPNPHWIPAQPGGTAMAPPPQSWPYANQWRGPAAAWQAQQYGQWSAQPVTGSAPPPRGAPAATPPAATPPAGTPPAGTPPAATPATLTGSGQAPPAAHSTASGGPPQQQTAEQLLPNVLGNLALRDLTLVESLLRAVEQLEEHEDDPEQLESLYRIDHLATRMRRNCENLLVLAGQETSHAKHEPTPLLDVVRAAVSEVTHYDRVRLAQLPRVQIVGMAADDISHLLAELLDNATSKSPEHTQVVVQAGPTSDGALVLAVTDSGIGIPLERLTQLNARLAAPPVLDVSVTRHMGLYVVGRMAHRHGIRVQVQVQPQGGTVAYVSLPARLLCREPADHAAPAPEDGHAASQDLPPPKPQEADAPLPTRERKTQLHGEPVTAAGLPRRTRSPASSVSPTVPTDEVTGDTPGAGQVDRSADAIRADLNGFQLGRRAASPEEAAQPAGEHNQVCGEAEEAEGQ